MYKGNLHQWICQHDDINMQIHSVYYIVEDIINVTALLIVILLENNNAEYKQKKIKV